MNSVEIMKKEMRDVVENNILSFWMSRMVDDENGGFYGQMTGEGQLVKDANKGCILNARVLWAFSAAYRMLRKSEYLEMAQRAKNYFVDHFIDWEQGGVFWELDCKGKPVDTKKQFYAIGFAIYALSEYARATGDRESLDYALQLYDNIEEYALDQDNNGYMEACTREWGEIADMRLSELDANYPKSQNTHLHILEPYTNLYRCLQEFHAASSCNYVPTIGSVLPVSITVPIETVNRVEASLRNLIDIFCNHILNPETHHLDLFFEKDWTRGAGHLESYGHDIECSWLLHEAALVLGDHKLLAKVETIVRMVAEAAEKGLEDDGSMLHEANLDTGYVDNDRHWWVQAETVVGYLNIFQHFGEEGALNKACRCWDYIKRHLIDYEGGEWWWSCDAAGQINRKDDKAGFWKCPYHNSRMCLEVLERF